MIYQICEVIMSISTRDRMHFLTYLLNHKKVKTWSIDRYKQGQQFSGIFRTFGRLGLSSRSSIEQPAPITE